MATRAKLPSKRRALRTRTLLIFAVLLGLGAILAFSFLDPGVYPRELLTFVFLLISIASFFAALVQISGWSLRDLASLNKTIEPPQESAFRVVQNVEELESLLLPNIGRQEPADRDIPYIDRQLMVGEEAPAELDSLLYIGGTKTGKTREIIEHMRRAWPAHSTVLVADYDADLTNVRLPKGPLASSLVVIIDDLSRFYEVSSLWEHLEALILRISEQYNGRLQLYMTLRAEDAGLSLNRSHPVAAKRHIGVIQTPHLSTEQSRELIDHICDTYAFEAAPEHRQHLAEKNDGTFLNIILSFRGWLAKDVTHIGQRECDEFGAGLRQTWRLRYEAWQSTPGAPQVYAALDWLSTMGARCDKESVIAAACVLRRPKLLLVWEGIGARLNLLGFGHKHSWLETLENLFVGANRGGFWWKLLVNLALVAVLVGVFWVPARVWELVFAPPTQRSDTRNIELLVVGAVYFSLLLLSLALLSWLDFWWSRQVKAIREAVNTLQQYEFPVYEQVFRPYEGQERGFGSSRSWPLDYFYDPVAGMQDWLFRWTAIYQVSAILSSWARADMNNGYEASALSLANAACALLPSSKPAQLLRVFCEVEVEAYDKAVVICRQLAPHWPHSRALDLLLAEAECEMLRGGYARVRHLLRQVRRIDRIDPSYQWMQGALTYITEGANLGLPALRHAFLLQVMSERHIPYFIGKLGQLGRLPDEIQQWFDNKRPSAFASFGHRVIRLLLYVSFLSLTLVTTAIFISGSLSIMVRERTVDLLDVQPSEQEATLLKPFVWLLEGPVEQLVPTQLLQMRYAYYEGRYADAVAIGNRLLRQGPLSTAYWGVADAEGADGHYAAAIEHYTWAIIYNPDNYLLYASRAQYSYLAGMIEQALADIDAAIQRRGSKTWLYATKCQIAVAAPENIRLEACSKAIELQPDNAYYYYLRAQAFADRQQWQEALADAETAVRLNPSDYAIALAQAGWMRRSGQVEQARSRLNDLLAQFPQYRYRTLLDLGQLEMDGFHWGAAETDFVQAIRAQPSWANAYLAEGRLLNFQGHSDAAILYAENALARDPGQWEAYIVRGDAHLASQRPLQAIADYAKAIEAKPRDPQAYTKIVQAYYEAGDFDTALAYAVHAAELSPTSSNYTTLGLLQVLRGDSDAAIFDYTEAMKGDGSSEPTLQLRAAAYIAGGQYEHAYADLVQAAMLALHNTTAAEQAATYQFAYLVNNRMATTGDTQAALAAYQSLRSLSTTPVLNPEAETLRAYGVWLVRDGKQQEAIEALHLATALAPGQFPSPEEDVAQALMQWVYASLASNDYTTAAFLIDEIERWYPELQGIATALPSIDQAYKSLQSGNASDMALYLLHWAEEHGAPLADQPSTIVSDLLLRSFGGSSPEAVASTLDLARSHDQGVYVVPEAQAILRSVLQDSSASLPVADTLEGLAAAASLDPYLAHYQTSDLVAAYLRVLALPQISGQEIVSVTHAVGSLLVASKEPSSASYACWKLLALEGLPRQAASFRQEVCKKARDLAPVLDSNVHADSNPGTLIFGWPIALYESLGAWKVDGKAGATVQIEALESIHDGEGVELTLLGPSLGIVARNVVPPLSMIQTSNPFGLATTIPQRDWYAYSYPLMATLPADGEYLLLARKVSRYGLLTPEFQVRLDTGDPGGQ